MAIARPTDPRPELSWSGWGDPTEVPVLSEAVLQLLRDVLGVSGPGTSPGAISALAIPEGRLGADAISELRVLIGEEHVASDSESRIRHALGKSTPDLLRIRSGELEAAPDLVLTPRTHDEVLEVLAICSARRIAVVPFGGGTSVVGGVQPDARRFAGVVALDLRRMNGLLALDSESRVAELEPGLRGPEAVALLSASGFTIGHFPQSFEYATLGGAAATRSSGQASAGYGRFDELVVGLRAATPTGTLTLGRAPKSAAGPDLRQLILGSEGAFGVITALSVQVRPAPAKRVYEGWRFGSFAVGTAALRRLAQDGPLPTVVRLSDEAETALNLARPGKLGDGTGGCLAIVGYEGGADDVALARAGATRGLAQCGAEPDLDAGAGWAQERYRGPYLRDALLDAGAIVETLETVAFWSSLKAVYAAVSAAVRDSLTAQGTPPVILCHISHVYRSGASLYFSVACAQLSDPIGQWRAAKAAASDAIIAAGGSITHHHGVGRDHLDWYEREIGPLGVQLLRAVKSTLDPAGILNPGILVGGG